MSKRRCRYAMATLKVATFISLLNLYASVIFLVIMSGTLSNYHEKSFKIFYFSPLVAIPCEFVPIQSTDIFQ